MESNDSHEIPDRGETSDIHGLPSRALTRTIYKPFSKDKDNAHFIFHNKDNTSFISLEAVLLTNHFPCLRIIYNSCPMN